MQRLHLFGLISIGTLATVGVLMACDGDDTNDAGGGTDAAPGQDGSTPTGDASPTSPTDSGAPDVAVEATTTKPVDYAAQVGEAICNALTRCCFGNANVPEDGGVDGGDAGAGHFDRVYCVSTYGKLGFERANVDVTGPQANVVVNATKGAECLSKINTLACNLDGPTLKIVRAACYDALEGQVAANAPCATSLQCARGLWCQNNPDAGANDAGLIGTCVPLRAQGQPCGDVQNTGVNGRDSVTAEGACSWRGGGDTGLACSSYDLVTGNYKPNRADWTCQPSLANAAICNTSVSCTNGLCDPGDNFDKYLCEATMTYFTKSVCGATLSP